MIVIIQLDSFCGVHRPFSNEGIYNILEILLGNRIYFFKNNEDVLYKAMTKVEMMFTNSDYK